MLTTTLDRVYHDAQMTQERFVTLPSGKKVSALGQGTWMMGDHAQFRGDEVAALRAGLDEGLTLIDTAEMYADGSAEEVVGEAIRGRRSDAFIVSKVYPHNATRQGTINACERSLKRLNIDCIDLYLLHWRGSTPLAEIVEAFEALVKQGKIDAWGVSNFDTVDMAELTVVPEGENVAINQVLYNLSRRAAEWSLMPWCHTHHVPIMAYSPIEQSRILHNPILYTVARRHDATPAQIALAWLLHQPDVIVIPKAGSINHVQENAQSRYIQLTAEDLNDLDQAFPPPHFAQPLETL